MTRFYGSIDSDVGSKTTTRTGRRTMRAHTRGWSVGVEAELQPGPGDAGDWAHASITGGSNGYWTKTIARARNLSANVVEVEVFGPEGQAGDPLTVFHVVDGSVDYDWERVDG